MAPPEDLAAEAPPEAAEAPPLALPVDLPAPDAPVVEAEPLAELLPLGLEPPAASEAIPSQNQQVYRRTASRSRDAPLEMVE